MCSLFHLLTPLAASSSKQGNIALLAAMKPVPHTGRRKFMPFANAVMAAQHAGWSMKLDVLSRSVIVYDSFSMSSMFPF